MYNIIKYDSYLAPFEKDINYRMDRLNDTIDLISCSNKSLSDFADAYKYYGIHKTRKGYIYREYAPKAKELYLIGDFNNWNKTSHKLNRINETDFEILINEDIENSKIKVRVVSNNFDEDRIPLYMNYVTRENDYSMTGRVFSSTYKFKYKKPRKKDSLFIYECHIGMAEEKEGYGSYDEFREIVLPKIKAEGFNAIQIMGVMEHPYYASFGYQVSNFYAPCSLFGTPDDLRRLIDEAHRLDIRVFLDVVHSHAVKNTFEGINRFDGSDTLFFRGDHPAWGTKIFDYGKEETLRFLLSNLKYYLDEFRFDGFRFDGVTSMLYYNFGLGEAFTDYTKYFSLNTDVNAINYLQMANIVVKKFDKNAITIAEDMSGMPGMCLPIDDGGIGFDYRLSLGEPDMWIKLIKEVKDEDWSMNNIYYELTSRRPNEKVIGYAECHDQALVGDKTIIFRLIDKDMYFHMLKSDNSDVVNRGIAIYKLIYGITMTLGGDGYLNFMGNEFGHPEWIDFPREGNGNSFKYAKRQWSLAENKDLKYDYLNTFNKDLIELCKTFDVLHQKDRQVYVSDSQKIISYIKGDLLFVLSFNYEKSFEGLFLQLNNKLNATLIFTTDSDKYGGFNRLSLGEKHLSINEKGADGVMVYLPTRSLNIYKLEK